jgi:hypothetical protein
MYAPQVAFKSQFEGRVDPATRRSELARKNVSDLERNLRNMVHEGRAVPTRPPDYQQFRSYRISVDVLKACTRAPS